MEKGYPQPYMPQADSAHYCGPQQPLVGFQPAPQNPQPYPMPNQWQGAPLTYNPYQPTQVDPANGAAYYQPQQQYYAPQGAPPSAPPPYMTAQPGPMGHGAPVQGAGWGPGPAQNVGAGGAGLSSLAPLAEVYIKQKKELAEIILDFETNNKYEIINSSGQTFLTAKEDTDCCSRQCFGSIRAFEMTVAEPSGAEVIQLSRPLACQACCFPCCLQSLEVCSPPGNLIATIKQEWTFLTPLLSIYDAAGAKIFTIEGPICPMSCFGSDVDFKVFVGAKKEIQIGSIKKQWGGALQEIFTDADTFGVTFPLDLDVKMKAALLGATFLIDFMYFEKSGDSEPEEDPCQEGPK